MSKNKARVLDELIGAASDSDEAESEKSDQDQTRKPKAVTLEDLERVGFKGGPSVLLMKRPEEDREANFSWSDGRAAKEKEPEHETWQERQQTHLAATEGAEQTGALAVKAARLAEQLREERKMEKRQQEQERKLSFNQKEKRKREEGKTSRAGSYVEEEKRLGRKYGMFSGFDT